MSTVDSTQIKRRVLTVKEFAEAIGLSRSSVYELIAAGLVKFINNPKGGKRIPLEEVDDYLRRNLSDHGKPGPSPTAAKGKRPTAADEPVAADGKTRLRL